MPFVKPLARIAIAVAALYAFFFAMTKVGNPFIDDVPDQGQLRSALNPQPTGPVGPTTRPPALPQGFPSMLFPPPKIDVPAGKPQPIATRYGTTYEVPPDWSNDMGAIAGWEVEDRNIAFSSTATLSGGSCQAGKKNRLALTGAAGRNGTDIGSAARDAVHDAETIFTSDSGRKPKVRYEGPSETNVSGLPAVRYTAIVSDIVADGPCDPPSARFDIVATQSFATSQVMILMVETHQGVPGSASKAAVDQIVSSLRRS